MRNLAEHPITEDEKDLALARAMDLVERATQGVCGDITMAALEEIEHDLVTLRVLRHARAS